MCIIVPGYVVIPVEIIVGLELFGVVLVEIGGGLGGEGVGEGGDGHAEGVIMILLQDLGPAGTVGAEGCAYVAEMILQIVFPLPGVLFIIVHQAALAGDHVCRLAVLPDEVTVIIGDAEQMSSLTVHFFPEFGSVGIIKIVKKLKSRKGLRRRSLGAMGAYAILRYAFGYSGTSFSDSVRTREEWEER